MHPDPVGKPVNGWLLSNLAAPALRFKGKLTLHTFDQRTKKRASSPTPIK